MEASPDLWHSIDLGARRARPTDAVLAAAAPRWGRLRSLSLTGAPLVGDAGILVRVGLAGCACTCRLASLLSLPADLPYAGDPPAGHLYALPTPGLAVPGALHRLQCGPSGRRAAAHGAAASGRRRLLSTAGQAGSVFHSGGRVCGVFGVGGEGWSGWHGREREPGRSHGRSLQPALPFISSSAPRQVSPKTSGLDSVVREVLAAQARNPAGPVLQVGASQVLSRAAPLPCRCHCRRKCCGLLLPPLGGGSRDPPPHPRVRPLTGADR